MTRGDCGFRNADETTGAVPSAPSLDLPDREPEVLNIGQRHVPGALRDLDYWVVWDGREKFPRAPWQEGTMYPCHWGAEADQDPRVGFERAKMVAELPIGELHRSWPFPDEEDLPEQVLPAVLLPHAPESSGLAVVDFDDVRDPDTGLVTGEVCELLERLNGYAEVSMSGTGIHVYVRGQLPEEVTAVSGPLQEPGQIEIYDHSRFTASTWRHIEGTPNSELADATEILRELAAAFNGRRINTA